MANRSKPGEPPGSPGTPSIGPLTRTGGFAASPRLRILDALRRRDFRLLFAGQTISQIGDAAFVVALGWRAFTLTHEASSLAIVLLVESAAVVATLLVGGVLADRYSRRTLLIVSDLARATVVAGLAAVDASGNLSFGILIGFVALQGLGSGLFQPAFGGIVPLLVDTAQLGSANALIGISRQAAFVIGPAIAGTVYGTAGSGRSSRSTPPRSSSPLHCSGSRVRARTSRGPRKGSVKSSRPASATSPRCRGSGSRSGCSRSS